MLPAENFTKHAESSILCIMKNMQSILRRLLLSILRNGRGAEYSWELLTFITLWNNLANDKLMIIYYFFPENKI